MAGVDLEAYVARSRAIDLSAFPWADVPRHPVPPEAIRTLRYMQDIESHTIIYLRELLATRAVDEPDVATFLACWLYEETFHGLALARFLEAAGHPVSERSRPRGQEPFLTSAARPNPHRTGVSRLPLRGTRPGLRVSPGPDVSWADRRLLSPRTAPRIPASSARDD
jgi:hypothetical protein